MSILVQSVSMQQLKHEFESFLKRFYRKLLVLQPQIYVMAAGSRASNSRNTSVWPESIRLGTRGAVMATRSVTVMEYYFYLWAGTRTSHTER